MRRKDERMVRKTAIKRGLCEEQIDNLVEYIDEWLEGCREAEHYVSLRQQNPVGFC